MVDDHVFVAVAEDYLFVAGLFCHCYVDTCEHLIMVPGMHKSSQPFGSYIEVGDFVALAVYVLAWLMD